MARKSGKKWLWIFVAVVALGGAIYAAVVVAQRQGAAKTARATADEEAPLSVPDVDAPWEVVREEEASIGIPKDWDKLDKFTPQALIYRKSNGKGGVPNTDEAGQELQATIMLEKVRMEPPLGDSANVIASRMLGDPHTEIVSRPMGDSIKLTDGTDAFLMHCETINNDTQRQLIIKLLAKNDPHAGYVVTGTITASKESRIPTIESPQARWLQALVSSMVIDANKLDARKVNRAYTQRDRK
jgi:hypothetical protein